MKKERFGEYQIIGILKSVKSGRLVKDVCQEHGIAELITVQSKPEQPFE